MNDGPRPFRGCCFGLALAGILWVIIFLAVAGVLASARASS